MTAKIIPVLEAIDHRIYVELFGGGASVLMAKPPKPVEVYNDLDHALYDFFKVLSDPRQFARFYRRVSVLPYHRQLYYDCRETWESEPDLIERTVKWYVVARQSFSGCFASSWSFVVTASGRDMSRAVSGWLSAIDQLPEVHARLKRVQIECNDFRKVIDTYDTPETLFYLDPPYIASTRKGGGYKHEMTDSDHRDLVQLLLNLKGQAVLSGYDSELYAPLLEAGWKQFDYQTACFAAGKTRNSKLQGAGNGLKHAARTETLWCKINQEKGLFG